MIMQKWKFQNTGLEFSGGFPASFRTFFAGTFSADISYYGGIDRISLIDTICCNGQIFPDRTPLALFSRNTTRLGRPMYGPAIRFCSTDKEGVRRLHYPENGRIYPNGFFSDSHHGTLGYCLGMEEGTLAAEFLDGGRNLREFQIQISKYHLISGPFQSWKNQFLGNEYGVEFLPEDVLTSEYRNKLPFEDGMRNLSWENIQFLPEENILLFSGKITGGDTEEQIYFVVSASAKLSLQENSHQWILSGLWNESGRIGAAMAADKHLSAALEKVQKGLKRQTVEQMIEKLSAREENVPQIELEGIPEAGDFARVLLSYQHALVLADDGTSCALRASAGKYGYFPLWDHIYPIRDFITGGDVATARKLIEFLLKYPHTETMIWTTSQLTLEIHELLSFKYDRDYLYRVFPRLKEFYRFSRHYAHESSGLIWSAHCCGVDNPAEVGLGKYFFASCVNAWYYNGLRALENLARQLGGEEDFAEELAEASGRLEKNYLKVFYHLACGYLRVAVDVNFQIPEVEIFHNSSTIGLDYPFGHYLLRSVVENLAGYKKRKLSHPGGYSAVAGDSSSPCEMWQSVYMNQHLGHDATVAALAGDAPEARRIMDCYLKEFQSYSNAIETFNLGGCAYDCVQKADWQAFSATGASQGIRGGLIGLFYSMGGLGYWGADYPQDVKIADFRFQERFWNIKIHGRGQFVKRFAIDGNEIYGTLQIPADCPQRYRTEWEIERSSKPFDRITLLKAIDLQMIKLSSTQDELRFTVNTDTHTDMLFYVPFETEISINGTKVRGEKVGAYHLWLTVTVKTADQIKLIQKNASTKERTGYEKAFYSH